ncbi:MAG TPA: FxsA family protein [Thermohalobaculum sp.]|nr:FxsA family protein [Thermohalobaculum sp.]
MPLFLLLVAVPIVEIALFIQVGGAIGLWPTIAIVVLTAIAGTALLRAQGLAALGELQRVLHQGGNPAPPLAHGALILVAGVLLLTPGFFTDGVGFLLLVPPVRAGLIRWLAQRMVVVQARGRAAGPNEGPQTVDADYEVVEPEDGTPHEGEPGDNRSGWTRLPD